MDVDEVMDLAEELLEVLDEEGASDPVKIAALHTALAKLSREGRV